MWLLRYHLVNYVWCEALTFFAILSNGTQLLQKGPHHHRLLHLPGQKLYYGSGSEESCQDVKEALTWNSPQLSWFAHTIVKGGVSIEIQQCPSVLCNTNVVIMNWLFSHLQVAAKVAWPARSRREATCLQTTEGSTCICISSSSLIWNQPNYLISTFNSLDYTDIKSDQTKIKVIDSRSFFTARLRVIVVTRY